MKIRKQNQNGILNSGRKSGNLKILKLVKMQKSRTSKDLRDGYSKRGWTILKWTQNHSMNITSKLQYKYNLLQVAGKNEILHVKRESQKSSWKSKNWF